MTVRLLLSTQRSGSHFLKSYVESRFANVSCSGEILREPNALAFKYPVLADYPGTDYFWPWYVREARAGNISMLPGARIVAFATYVQHLGALVDPKDLLLDIKYNSIRSLSGYWDSENGSEDFTGFVRDNELPVLHLIRQNILKLIISNKVASQTGIWHRTADLTPADSLPRIHLNPKSILFDIRYMLKITQDYQTRFSGYPHYEEISYEDFVQETRDTLPGTQLRTLARFLNDDPIEAELDDIPLKKTTPDDPSEIIENWEEIVRILNATEYGWMANSPLLAAA